MNDLKLIKTNEVDTRIASREEYDYKVMRAIMDCVDVVAMGIKGKEGKEIKEAAGTLEVLTRTAYRILSIPLPKDTDVSASNDNLDKLLNLLENEVKDKDG